jgi:hypothetical protein
MRLIIERQNDLVVCRVKACDHWFFTACYRGAKELLGFDFPPGAKFEFNLTASDVRRLDTIDDIGHETNINQIGGDTNGEEES